MVLLDSIGEPPLGLHRHSLSRKQQTGTQDPLAFCQATVRCGHAIGGLPALGELDQLRLDAPGIATAPRQLQEPRRAKATRAAACRRRRPPPACSRLAAAACSPACTPLIGR